jgi:hypothetical protein
MRRVGSRTFWIVVAVATAIGVAAGRAIYAMADVPSMAAMLALFALVLWVAILGIVLLVGLIATVVGDRATGPVLMLMAAVMGLASYLAGMYGDGPQVVSERPARIEVTLDSPIDRTWSGSGTCFTVANGETIRRIEGEAFIGLGDGRYSISIVIDDSDTLPRHRAVVVADDPEEVRSSYFDGITAEVDVVTEGQQTSGSATFTGLSANPGQQPIEGAGGPVTTLDGGASWTCGD